MSTVICMQIRCLFIFIYYTPKCQFTVDDRRIDIITLYNIIKYEFYKNNILCDDSTFIYNYAKYLFSKLFDCCVFDQ